MELPIVYENFDRKGLA